MEAISKGNRIKLLTLIYVMMISCGAAVILPYVLKVPASKDLHLTLITAGFAFSFYMLGMLFGEIVSSFVVKFVNLKTEIYLLGIIYILNMIFLYHIHGVGGLIGYEIILGVLFGITATIPFYIVIHTYEESGKRASQANLLDFFFGVGSFTFPFIVSTMLVNHIDWKLVYVSIIILIIVEFIIVAFTKMPNVEHNKNEKSHFSKWKISTYFVGLAIFLNFVSFMAFNYWAPSFLISTFHIKDSTAVLGLSFFWIFYAIGCFAASFIVRKIPENKYILISAVIALIGYGLIFISFNTVIMFVAISVLGYGCSTIYGSSIAYGSSLLKKPSPRLVSFFIVLSGIGTWFAQFYSGPFRTIFGAGSIIIVSAILMVIVFVIIYIISKKQQKI